MVCFGWTKSLFISTTSLLLYNYQENNLLFKKLFKIKSTINELQIYTKIVQIWINFILKSLVNNIKNEFNS